MVITWLIAVSRDGFERLLLKDVYGTVRQARTAIYTVSTIVIKLFLTTNVFHLGYQYFQLEKKLVCWASIHVESAFLLAPVRQKNITATRLCSIQKSDGTGSHPLPVQK